MLYIIGLGLNIDGISKQGLEIVQRCKHVYLENYTVDFPYSQEELEKAVGKKTIPADRELVESLDIVDESKKMDVGLLVYGSPLFATTHISLIQEAKKLGVKYEIIYSASVFDAIAETGLQLYKFGKIASMPDFKADSFMDVVKDNQKINAYSLILIDIGMEFKDALDRLIEVSKKNKIKLDKMVVCSQLGTKAGKIFYKKIGDLSGVENIKKPFCFIIPGKLHFVEKDVLENV